MPNDTIDLQAIAALLRALAVDAENLAEERAARGWDTDSGMLMRRAAQSTLLARDAYRIAEMLEARS